VVFLALQSLPENLNRAVAVSFILNHTEKIRNLQAQAPTFASSPNFFSKASKPVAGRKEPFEKHV
jgi:hypothetical protein